MTEKETLELLAKVVKQNSELHYLMGRLQGAMNYGNEEQVFEEVDLVLMRYSTMKGIDQ